MMTMLSEHAVVCLESIKCEYERKNLIEEITNPELNPEGTHKILEIS